MDEEIPLNQNATFLVVDDSNNMCQYVRNLLGEIGYTNIHELNDGLQAIEFIDNLKKKETIDFIITDINMPNVKGDELVTLIRQHKRLSQVPILVMSSDDKIKTVLDLLYCGANSFIIKPFESRDLRKKLIETVLVQQQANEKYEKQLALQEKALKKIS